MVLTQGPAGQHHAFFLKFYLGRAWSPPPPTLLLPREARIMSTFFSSRADSSWPSWGSFVSLFSCIPCGRRHICLGTVWLGRGCGVMHPCRRIRKTLTHGTGSLTLLLAYSTPNRKQHHLGELWMPGSKLRVCFPNTALFLREQIFLSFHCPFWTGSQSIFPP